MEGLLDILKGWGTPKAVLGIVPDVIYTLVVLVVGWLAVRIILTVTRKALERSPLDVVLYRFILTIIKIVLYVVILLMILGHFTPISGLITILAASGAAVALALKDSLSNIAGGVMILITKPFTQNDFVDINGTTGKVKDIDLFVTHLKTFDNKVISIPNGMVNTSVLVNYTQENKRRVDCSFGIGYRDDINEAKNILLTISDSNPKIFKEPRAIIGVAGQRETFVELDLKVWCETEDYWDVKYFLEESVKLAFDEAGINRPFV